MAYVIIHVVYKYLILLLLLSPRIQAGNLVKVFPENCYTLLPDYGEYIDFLEDMGVLWSYSSTFYAKQIFKFLAIRELYQTNNIEINNPVDNDVRQLLCNCRIEIKEESVASSSQEMKKCVRKQIAGAIKTASKRYKLLMNKKNVLVRSGIDRQKYQKRIDQLKRSAYNDIKYQF